MGNIQSDFEKVGDAFKEAGQQIENGFKVVGNGVVNVTRTAVEGTVDTANTVADGTVMVATIIGDSLGGFTDEYEKTYENVSHFSLAPSFGANLTSDSCSAMDKYLLAAIGETFSHTVNNKQSSSWDETLQLMSTNKYLQETSSQSKSSTFDNGSTEVFKSGQSVDEIMVGQMCSWFRNFIGDSDILDSLHLDINSIARVASTKGTSKPKSLASAIRRHERYEKTIVDIGLLEFPDVSKPYFTLYRIQLTSWSDSTRTMFVEENSNGITSDLTIKTYKPNVEFMQTIAHDVLQIAIAEAENLFSSAKPRQNVTDYGYDDRFHAWVDVQGLGIRNDYARYVGPGNEHQFVWLSVALAGSSDPYTPPGMYKEENGIVTRN
ncbi:unnamed protein product [Rotaria sordida]|uniref:Uncharacterized protein n=1 Tax=Rotaria sordida TaxID=392033 RepID=A0A819I217_9BILA|nr:unnamed protein product [Rotaria sordida]CAF3911732.1 unnamed protein product [Rotaria sordida]